ncbi:MAG: hypothetical protein A4E19_19600 [Nitrospira sp. SG-bin1]|nr:MAG: hypothetical protein A4E19_19600 [Nitrospira sp. SG-bin1]
MSQIFPFQGILYDQTLVGAIENVVAPPYDIIDAHGQKQLHDRHPHNIIRMELGLDQPGDDRAHNRYTRAAATLQTWLNDGILKRDTRPAVYYHTIEYTPPYSPPDAPKKILRGFLALAKLEALDSGHIYPHENTRAAAKTDRLNLIEACRSNFSPIWSLYSDPLGAVIQFLETAVKGTPARYDFQDDAGCRERLWAVTEEAVLKQITDAMQSKPLFIADGHHRYETALNYQKLRRQQTGPRTGLQPYDSVLMLLAPLEDPGLTVLPTHRVTTTPLPPWNQIKTALSDLFEFREFPFNASTERQARAQFLTSLRTEGKNAPVFGLTRQGDDRYVTLTLKPAHRPSSQASPRARLDVSLLQQLIVTKLCPTQQEQEAIVYTKDDHEALDWAANGTGTGAFLLNATKVSEVQAVAAAGERMPHKSTYFYPKPLTGLVINVMHD